MRVHLFSIAMCSCFLLAGVLAAHAQEVGKCEVAITTPHPGDQVGKSGKVRGTATIPKGTYLWVLAHMKDLTAEWWPQGRHPAVIGKGGEWVIIAGYGEPNDVGEKFEVAAVVVDANTNTLLLNWSQTAEQKHDFTPIEFPSSAQGCVPLKVTVMKTSHHQGELLGEQAVGEVLPYWFTGEGTIGLDYHVCSRLEGGTMRNIVFVVTVCAVAACNACKEKPTPAGQAAPDAASATVTQVLGSLGMGELDPSKVLYDDAQRPLPTLKILGEEFQKVKFPVQVLAVGHRDASKGTVAYSCIVPHPGLAFWQWVPTNIDEFAKVPPGIPIQGEFVVVGDDRQGWRLRIDNNKSTCLPANLLG